MGKYSKYFVAMMILATVFLGLGLIALELEIGVSVAVVMFVLSFIVWFVAVNAPNHEKYTRKYRTRL